MKSVLVLAAALFAVAFAYPRPDDMVERDDDSSEPDGEAEFVRVPLTKSYPREPTGFAITIPDLFAPQSFDQDPFFRASPWGGVRPQAADGPDGEHVDDFMTQMQEMLREMRKQLKTLIDHSRDHGIGGGDEDSVGTRIGGGESPKNESTSTTKVIDGHVVTVNETTYSSGDDKVGAVFKVRIVEVVPSETPDTEKPEEPSSSEAPDTENTNKKSELDDDKHEEANEIPDMKVRYVWSPEFDPSLNEIDQPEEDDIEQFTPTKNEKYYDLTSDTKVNDFISDQAESQGLVMIDPDAELIDTNANTYYRYDTEPQREQRFLV